MSYLIWYIPLNSKEIKAWELLLPHLFHHLEENRKRQRRIERQETLNTVMSEMKNDLKPFLCIQPQNNTGEWTLASIATLLNLMNNLIDPVCYISFFIPYAT
jgi:hypothetical protein